MVKVGVGLFVTIILALLGSVISTSDSDFGWYFKVGAVLSGMATLTRLQDELWSKGSKE